MRTIKIGLVGTGFMGRTHAHAYQCIRHVFGDEVVPELEMVADLDLASAEAFARKYGFKRYTDKWEELVADPEIVLVDITTPNASHCPIAIAAAKNGKHVYSEKPLSLTAEEGIQAAEVIEKAGVVSAVGYNYIWNPIQQYVKEVIISGELGNVINFRGMYDQDYYNDPNQQHEWRMFKSASASGTLGDLASHTISLSQYLVGAISEVCGMTKIVVPELPNPKNPSEMLPVENDDVVQFMFTYENGAIGAICSSRLAAGRKMSLGYEIQLEKGCIVFNQEQQNQVQIYRHAGDKRERGFKTVLVAPGHGDFEIFFGGAGIGLGYADQKTIEAYRILKSIADGTQYPIDFRFGAENMQIVDAVLKSDETRQWVKISEVGKA